MLRLLAIVFSASLVVTSGVATAADEDVRQVFENYIKLMVQCDTTGQTLAATKARTTPDWQIVSDRGVHDRSNAYLQPKDCGKSAEPARISNLKVRTYGGDTAVLTGRLDFPGGGGQFFTSVWVLQGGKWLEASEHNSDFPADKK